MVFETLTVSQKGAVVFAEIAAPPMNLPGPELVRDLVSLIQQAEADDTFKVLVFKSAGSEFVLFADAVRTPEVQGRLGAALRRGFQTREAELDLAQMLGNLARLEFVIQPPRARPARGRYLGPLQRR
jgi:enoyl-CoA hydratase/carnithine racemase